MNTVRISFFLVSFLLLTRAALLPVALAEEHRATVLGNPETRFAPPLYQPQDLRDRFRDERLRPDIAEILRQWGWTGNLEDLFRAAATAPIEDIRIAVGEKMPFMSSRKNGKPICLRNVYWEGAVPAPAYAFNFNSKGRRYRCITPKFCSNFFVVDQGPMPVPRLEISCALPQEVLLGKPFEACFTINNPGSGIISNGVVDLPIPKNLKVAGTSSDRLTWAFTNLPPNADKKFCAEFIPLDQGDITLTATASGSEVTNVTTACSTKAIGIPAILIDAVDLEDPVEVGKEVVYEIKVTNQGSSDATNVRLLFTLPINQEFISGGGPTKILATDLISTDPLPLLVGKGVATWKVVVKATQPGDVRFKIALTSDQFTKPINEEESTLLY